MADSMPLDEIQDLFKMLEDFPIEGIDDWAQFPDPPPNIQFPDLSGLFGESTDFITENKTVSVSYDETCGENQFLRSAETTSTGGALISDDSLDAKPTHIFRSSSPVSILESTGSFLAENPKATRAGGIPAKRARTKRLCSWPSTSDWLRRLSLIWSEAGKNSYLSNSDPTKRTFQKKKNKTVNKSAWPEFSQEANGDQAPEVGKKCAHCQVTSTPQWREGPMGPKTLCNACGVRYRSGRLFPEYRPAASPTFIPTLHSNSHKKVVEMRNKASSSSNNNNNNNFNNNSNGRVGLKPYCRSLPGKSAMHLIV